jgi:hypothetical protein
MYKKVTHTILEEHFGHPLASEIKEAVDKKVVPPKYKMEPASIDKFRLDINNYLTSLNTKLLNIFRSIDSNDEAGLLDSEKVLFDEIDVLGNMYKPYYGIEFGEKFNQYMRTAVLIFIAIAKNLKAKTDIRDWRTRLDGIKFDLANLLYSYNNIWRLPDTPGMIGQIFTELINHIQAMVNKDVNATNATHTNVSNLLSVFANNLANGTIQQFPGKFISTK